MVNKQHGVTLIELLVTVILLGILATKIMPLGRAWMADTNINNAEKLLIEALGKARNEALRNPNGVIGPTTMAATVTVNNTAKTIVVSNNASTTIWQATMPAPTSITFSPTCTNIQLNNNSQNISACTTYTVTANGGTDATGKL